MKFNLSELEELFNKIENVLSYYEKMKLNNKKFTLCLSNGEIINFNIRNNALAHLLGIKMDYLLSTNIFKEKDSYNLLLKLIENPYKIHTLSKDGIINYDKLFSKHIKGKIDSFIDNMNFDARDIEFVCCYDPKKTYHLQDTAQKFDYIIVKRYDNGKMGAIMLAKNGNYCVPMSNRIYDDYDSLKTELKDILENQEIAFAFSNRIYNISTQSSSGVSLYPYAKQEKVQNLQFYKNELKVIPDITQDYLFNLSKSSNQYKSKVDEESLIDRIAEGICQGSVIDEYSESRLNKIIEAFNDSLYKGKTGDITTYTELKNELVKLREQIVQITEENTKLKSENDDLKTENSVLTGQASENAIKLQKIYELAKPSE